MFQIECIKMFVNTACGRLGLIVYDQLITNKQRRNYEQECVAFHILQDNESHRQSTVVSLHHWLCIANSSNVTTCGNDHKLRNSISPVWEAT